MANPTTNYSFAMPTNTDLVKDLPADFDIFGQAVDDRIKALNPETTAGDISYRASTANAKSRLAIGTAGQVLTVNSGATAPEWTTLSSGGITLINTGGTTLSGATTTISSIPTSYKNLYLVIRDVVNSVDDQECYLYFNSDTGNNYNTTGYLVQGGTIGAWSTNSTNKIRWAQSTTNTTVDNKSNAIVNIYDYTSTGQRVVTSDQRTRTNSNNNSSSRNIGTYFGASAITSITFSNYSGNYNSGTVFVYGVA